VRTLVLTTTFPQFEGDPRGAFIRTHWEQRASRGETVTILAPRSAWCAGSLRGACRVVRVRYAPKWLSSLTGNFGILENVRDQAWRALLLPLLWRASSRALETSIDRWRPRRVAAHMLLPAGWIVASTCSARSLPFELYGHGTDVDILLRAPLSVRRRFWSFARAAEQIYFPSNEKRARFAAAFGLQVEDSRLQVEPMVHCVPAPPVASSGAHRPRRGRAILYLGRLIEQKGIDDLLHAVAMLRPARPLHIAGDGPHRRRLQRLARRLGVEASFHGFVSGVAKERLLEEAGVLCVPSREARGGLSEGAPLVIREALAWGLPVVATSIGGIPELCHGAGRVRLVPPGDPASLSLALDQMLDPREEQAPARARRSEAR
jgi:glycosyltransferase involved in cell wall biosynthesis